MSNDFYEQYLDKKYAEYDDESDVVYKKRRHVDKRVKKSNHKHEYENVVVIDPDKYDSFHLVSRCNICGKIGEVQCDKRIEKKFPHVSYKSWLLGYIAGFDNEYEDFIRWCKKHYTVYEIPDLNIWNTKYI